MTLSLKLNISTKTTKVTTNTKIMRIKKAKGIDTINMRVTEMTNSLILAR